MNNWSVIFAAVCFGAAAGLICWNQWRVKKTMDTIEKMLDLAMDGSFSEKTFDESRLSALETRFAHYLAASAVSARNTAREKERIKALIGDISHQTKTPIANLLLYSEILLEEKLPAGAKTNVEQIHAQSEKLRFLIDSLVKLSRLENGIVTLNPRPAPLQPILEGVAAQYSPRARQKGLGLNLKATALTVICDPKWTAEALANMVDNAVKYTAQGAVTLSVTGYELFVRIDIADTGMGISEGEQAKIFSRFYRSDSVKDEQGVGIGLYLARQILSEQGGYIKVTSRPGEGSTFSVFLPKAAEILPKC